MDAIVYDKVGKEAEKVREALYGIYPQETITDAAIASFDDGADGMPIKKLVAQIVPVQDLHGQANPYPPGGGKNLIDFTVNPLNGITAEKIDGKAKITGTATLDTYPVNGVPVTLQPGNYTWSVDGVTTGVGFTWTKNGSWAGPISNGTTFTLSEQSTISFYVGIASGIAVNTTIGISLESGSSSTGFAPYSNICPISGHTGAEVTRTGKNLFDLSSSVTGYLNSSGQVTQDVQGVVSDFILVKAGQYTASRKQATNWWKVVVYGLDQSFKSMAFNLGTLTERQFTIAEDSYIRLGLDYVATSADEVQLELGSTATDYEPYTGNQISVTFPSEAGTVYGGEDEIISGKLKSTMGMVDLGTLYWVRSTAFGGSFLSTLPLMKSSTAQSICSMYVSISGEEIESADYAIYTKNNGRNIYVKDSRYTDATSFKAAVSGVQLCYELSEPVEYTTEPKTIPTLYGTNNIWANTGNIEKLTYRADLGRYIDSHITTAVANALNA